jgi:hypothetical protein
VGLVDGREGRRIRSWRNGDVRIIWKGGESKKGEELEKWEGKGWEIKS